MRVDDTGLGDLHDPRLWRALEHAPDHGAAPDWRIRNEILKQARAAIGESDPEEAEAELERAAQSWWQRLAVERAAQEKPRRRWPAVVAVAMVAFVAVMLWRREPALLSAPSLDDKTSVAASSSRAEEPTPVPSAPKPPPTDSSSVPLLPPSFFTTPKLPADSPEPESLPPPEPAPLPEKAAAAPLASPAPRSAPAQALPPPPVQPPPPPQKVQKPPPAPPPLPPAASPQPPPQQQREVVASAKPAPAAAPAASSSVRTDETEPPTFEALGQWNRITISKRGGESRSLPRADAREVSGLLASAALSAVGPQPMKGTPEWRVTLERGAEVLAVFEVSGQQVRWREGRTPAATGVPSKGSLSARRDALGQAVQETQPAPGEPLRSP